MKKILFFLNLFVVFFLLVSCQKDPQFVVSEVNGKLGMVSIKGENVIPYQFDYIGDLKENLFCVMLGDKWGFIDKNGKYIINPQFDGASFFKNGIALVAIDNLVKFITPNGAYIANAIIQEDIKIKFLEIYLFYARNEIIGIFQ